MGINKKRALVLVIKLFTILVVLNLSLYHNWTGPSVLEAAAQSAADPMVTTDTALPAVGSSGMPRYSADEVANIFVTLSDLERKGRVSNPTGVKDAVFAQKVVENIYGNQGKKVAYLTFDDGPTPVITTAVLDILREEDVKATFFVIGKNAERYPELVKRQYDEGHGVANHTYSHNFRYLYSDVNHLISELLRTEELLKSILGADKAFKLFRFPGGSFGKSRAPYRHAANQAGYFHIDWNSVNGDAESRKTLPESALIKRLTATAAGKDTLVILMHDAPHKGTTVSSLPTVIRYLKAQGYRFELLPWAR